MLNREQTSKLLKCPNGPLDMVLDTDTYNEIDDQYAISYAVTAAEKLHVRAFYAAPFTNERSSGPADGMEKSYHEIQKVLKLAGKEGYPVFRGSASYLPDEKTPVLSDAARDFAERAMAYTPERPLYVVSIAAITRAASRVHFVNTSAMPTSSSSIGRVSANMPMANSGSNSYRIMVLANMPGSDIFPNAE